MSIQTYSRVCCTVLVLGFLQFFSLEVQAQTRMTMVSEPGDYIGQGQTTTYDVVVVNIFSNSGTINVSGYAPGHDVFLSMAVPPGETVSPGVYRFGPGTAGAGMSVSLDYRGCSGASGRYEIVEASFDTDGRARRFLANFEYHCDGLEKPGVYGEIAVVGPPPPRVSFDFVVDDQVKLDRITETVTVSGIITCSETTNATIYAIPNQIAKRDWLVTATAVIRTPCSPLPLRWSASVPTDVSPSGTRLGFHAGDADVSWSTSVVDENYHDERIDGGDHPVTVVIDNR